MSTERVVRPILLLALLVSLGCGTSPERAPAIGEAFVGPSSLNLRQDLTPRSPVTATAKHGERLDLIQRRRRFVKARTAQGAEGWTDSRQLLTPEQMTALRRARQRAASLPSQGQATVYEPLNVHTEPNRQAPSFHQIPQREPVDVIGHRVAARIPYQPTPTRAAEPAPAAPVRKLRKKKQGDAVPPPPPPAPPRPPDNWLELSAQLPETRPPAAPTPQPVVQPPPPAAPMEDWSLVRTRDGKVGWVLSRMLVMAIPDEVAQYAEGHRITSYFSLGKVADKDQTKDNWLWTTNSQSAQPFQFDSVRVFVWSLRRHRYETAYIERNLKGFYPVQAEASERPVFSLIVEEKDGKLYRRTYGFSGFRVRMTSKQPWEAPAEPAAAPAQDQTGPPVSATDETLWRRLRARVTRLFGR